MISAQYLVLKRVLWSRPCQIRTYASSYGPKRDDSIIVAMSSGVDSSVVAAMMAEKHTDVTGVFMHNWYSNAKCAESDWNDVQKVCQQIGIPCKRLNFEKEYWINVFEPMITSYSLGDTPNPDVSCNRYVKFGALYRAIENSFANKNWWLATGHYSKLVGSEESPSLMRPRDLSKDQTYYLSTVKSFKRVFFPLGDLLKSEVRQLAKEKYRLPTAEKPDSQGLCFVSQSERKFSKFLGDYIENKPGNIVTSDGLIVGRHSGIWNATIGQKSGISMPQGDPRFRGIWYVSDKDFTKNEITIVQGVNNPALFNDTITTESFHWLGSSCPDLENLQTNLYARHRSLAPLVKIKSLTINENGNLIVRMKEPQRGLARGQYLVLYNGDEVLGGGLIKAYECSLRQRQETSVTGGLTDPLHEIQSINAS